MNWRRANLVLVILIIVVNLYTITAPLLPGVAFWWQNNHTHRHQQLAAEIAKKPTNKKQPNHIVIPDMLLDKPIYDGPVSRTYRILDKGIWRYPLTSQPGQKGNTVLIGHRFTYTNPRGVFYSLDKVKIDSRIAVFWNNKKYLYRVTTIKVVPNTDLSVQAQTTDTRLTMYTCTPLWHPVNRLVVVAKPETKP
jgi:sortase A